MYLWYVCSHYLFSSGNHLANNSSTIGGAFDSVSNALRMRGHRNVRIIKVLYIISGIVNYGIELIALEWHMSAWVYSYHRYCIPRIRKSASCQWDTHTHRQTRGVSSGECRNIVALNPTALNLPLIRGPINHAKAAKEPASQLARLACSLALSPIRQANVMHATGADHQLLHAGWSETKAITITQSSFGLCEFCRSVGYKANGIMLCSVIAKSCANLMVQPNRFQLLLLAFVCPSWGQSERLTVALG